MRNLEAPWFPWIPLPLTTFIASRVSWFSGLRSSLPLGAPWVQPIPKSSCSIWGRPECHCVCNSRKFWGRESGWSPEILGIPGATVGIPGASWLSPDTWGRMLSYCRKGQVQADETQRIEAGRIGGCLLFTAKLPEPRQDRTEGKNLGEVFRVYFLRWGTASLEVAALRPTYRRHPGRAVYFSRRCYEK